MESQNRILLIAAVVVSLIVVVIMLQPAVRRELAPELKSAWVGIEVAGSGEAVVGPVEIASGTAFTLHAVVEAEDRRGRPIFYTEAPRLRFPDRQVAPESLRRWDLPEIAKMRWFTVEGRRPFVELEPGAGPGELVFEELLRSDWPIAWSIPGDLSLANVKHLSDAPITRNLPFGTQRYQVRLELYDDDEQMIPSQTIRAWGSAEVGTQPERFPTVRAALPGRLAAASEVFGLIHVEPGVDTDPETLALLEGLSRRGLVFSRATVLRDHLQTAGRTLESLLWSQIELDGSRRWDDGVAAGDLLRAGNRVVVLYEDRGEPGVVDYADLCFDYVQGAKVRELRDVFTGEGLVVELAALGAPS